MYSLDFSKQHECVKPAQSPQHFRRINMFKKQLFTLSADRSRRCEAFQKAIQGTQLRPHTIDNKTLSACTPFLKIFYDKTYKQIIDLVGWKQLATQGLVPRAALTGTIIASQWFLYDSFKSIMGLGTSGGGCSCADDNNDDNDNNSNSSND